jgi:hypothetical protein
MGLIIYLYKIVVGKYKGKRPLERTSYKWQGSIKMDLLDMYLQRIRLLILL